jgi:hypothetical protein
MTLADAGLRLIVDESGTFLEFMCTNGRILRLRINDLGEQLDRHEAEILRIWSAERQTQGHV